MWLSGRASALHPLESIAEHKDIIVCTYFVGIVVIQEMVSEISMCIPRSFSLIGIYKRKNLKNYSPKSHGSIYILHRKKTLLSELPRT
jgi:hypothetical protein